MTLQTRSFLLLSHKDLQCLVREPGRLVGLATFVLIIVVLASVGLREVGLTPTELFRTAPGVLWVINAFSAILALQYTASIEDEDSGILGVITTGVDTSLVYLSKCGTSWLIVFFLEFLALLFMALFLNLPILSTLPLLVEVTILSSLAIAAVGVLLSGISASLASNELLLPILLFPIILPILCAAVFLTSEALSSGSFDRFGFWYILLCCFSVVSVSLGSILYEQVVR